MVTLQASRPESLDHTPGRTASDDVSEFYHYEDTGCEASDSCLDCPLPVCKYDNPDWYHRNRRFAKDFRIVQIMQQESLSVAGAAERFGITPRTVFRIMQRCREASMQGNNVGEGLLRAA